MRIKQKKRQTAHNYNLQCVDMTSTRNRYSKFATVDVTYLSYYLHNTTHASWQTERARFSVDVFFFSCCHVCLFFVVIVFVATLSSLGECKSYYMHNVPMFISEKMNVEFNLSGLSDRHVQRANHLKLPNMAEKVCVTPVNRVIIKCPSLFENFSLYISITFLFFLHTHITIVE